MRDLVYKFADIFSVSDKDLGRTALAEMVIDTRDSKPIFQRPYRAEFQKRAIIEKEVNKYLEMGIIEPSVSSWSSPVVLVTKKDGSIRFCVNYIKLNEVTVRDSYPLPRIHDLLSCLGNSKYFVSLDLASGYHQVPVSDQLDSKNKTTFTCFLGTFRFKYMPFGPKNAPMVFQRLMERVLTGILYKICFVFIDDLLVKGDSFSDLLCNVETVFERLRSANLKLKLKKCEFGMKQIAYLGHRIDAFGVHVDPAKTDKISKLPPPQSVKALKSFLGVCGYYSRFIARYSDITQAFQNLLKKGQPYVWTEEHQLRFEQLKRALCSAPVLAFPDFEKEFRVYTDASEYALGGVDPKFLFKIRES